MRNSGQALLGMLAAVLSAFIVFGSLALSLAEGNVSIALIPSATATSTQPVPTQKPGESTYTPSPTSLPSSTPTMITPSGACDYPDGWVQYTVEMGDTWTGLAERFGFTVEILQTGNCGGFLEPGYVILVPTMPPSATYTMSPVPTATPTFPPAPTRTAPVSAYCPRPAGWVDYYVKQGDTLYRLGLTYGISYRVLMDRNCLTSTVIRVGQRLYVPYLIRPTIYPSPTIFYPPTSVPTNTSVPPTATSVPPSSTPVTPTTAVPTTAVPTTVVPTTAVPTTAVPTTVVPTTAVPTTAEPTTAVPTTAVPTPVPTTPEPTPLPTTAVPPTDVPTSPPPTAPLPPSDTLMPSPRPANTQKSP